MKSPNSTEYTTLHEPVAPSTQFVRRGFREVAAPDVPLEPYDPETLGLIQHLPLEIQAAFRRKLIAIIALQLFVISFALAVIEFTSAEARHWIDTHFVHDSFGLLAAYTAALLLLLLLYATRTIFPLNWAVLVLFSTVQTLCLAVVDLSLDSHAVFFNVVFTWVCATLMVGMVGWTRKHEHGCCGLACTWHPIQADDLERNSSRNGLQLVPPFIIELLAFAIACALVLLVHLSDVFDTHWSAADLVISFFAQLLVGFWLVYEIKRMHQTMTPDAYMGGVIFLYTDLVAATAAIAVYVAAILCLAGLGGDGTATVSFLDVSECCCVCVDSTVRSNAAAEEEY